MCKDLKRTYKDFLLTLIGIGAFTLWGKGFDFAALVGVILFLICFVRMFNALLYDDIFNSKKDEKEVRVPAKQMIINKIIIIVCYSTFSYFVFLAGLYYTGQYELLSINLSVPVDFSQGLGEWKTLIFPFITGAINFTTIGMSLLVIMLFANSRIS